MLIDEAYKFNGIWKFDIINDNVVGHVVTLCSVNEVNVAD